MDTEALRATTLKRGPTTIDLRSPSKKTYSAATLCPSKTSTPKKQVQYPILINSDSIHLMYVNLELSVPV